MIFQRLAALFLIALPAALFAAPPTWEQKVQKGQAVLDYLDLIPSAELRILEEGRPDFLERPRNTVAQDYEAELTTKEPGSYILVPVPEYIASGDFSEFLAKSDKLRSRIVPGNSNRMGIEPLDSFSLADRRRWRWLGAKQAKDGTWKPAAHARWNTKITSRRNLQKLTSPTVKGMGGIDRPVGLDELVELGIGHATVNIHLSGLLHPEDKPGTFKHGFESKYYHINQRSLERLDEIIGFLTKNKIVVSTIILVTPPRGEPRHVLIHPEAEPGGTLAMPNLATPEGANAFCAAIDFLAERYTREDAKYGRISNWIAHNEVDQAWTWTNMGEQPLPRLLETYHRSMRLMHLATRRYDPHARVFASFTHHWNQPGDGRRTYRTRGMLELLNRLSKAEGDFEWGIAYHPYPQDLRNPRTWEDEQPTFSFDTPKITMRNIEVLDAFLKQPEFLFEGAPRPILLSEQGFNTPDYSPENQRDQAAALFYAWKKLEALPSIEAFHYHRWIDHPHEGGLKLGLRTLPGPDKPLGDKKLAWDLYRALDTPRQAAAGAFAREVLGIPDFTKIPWRGPITKAEQP